MTRWQGQHDVPSIHLVCVQWEPSFLNEIKLCYQMALRHALCAYSDILSFCS